jgi:hypothetical protein
MLREKSWRSVAIKNKTKILQIIERAQELQTLTKLGLSK